MLDCSVLPLTMRVPYCSSVMLFAYISGAPLDRGKSIYALPTPPQANEGMWMFAKNTLFCYLTNTIPVMCQLKEWPLADSRNKINYYLFYLILYVGWTVCFGQIFDKIIYLLFLMINFCGWYKTNVYCLIIFFYLSSVMCKHMNKE